MLAFYTLMAPAVALTYPIDKMKDGKAQAFNFWLKDYIFYALLQPLHMILYTVFVNSALELAVNNMLYAIVAMAFIVPAEKIVKQMFGIKGNTEDRAKGFAGGAVAGSIFSNAKKLQGGAGKSAPKDGGKASASNKIPTFKNENPPKTFDVMAEEAANKAKEDAEREKAEKEAAKQARQDAAADAARAAELEAERKAAEEARQMAEKASAEAAEANAENTQRTASEEQEAAQTGNSSQLTPEQLQELNNQGIAPGTPEYNQYLAEHGIENGTQTPEVEVSPSTPRQVANTPTTRQRRLLGQKGKARRALDYINNRATDAGGWGTIAKKAGLGAAKGLVKGYATIGTAAALGAAGVGIGAVGGDLSDVAKGLTAGVTTGAVIGKRTGKSITSGAGYVLDAAKGNNGLGRFKEEVWDGMTSEEMDKKQYVTAYTESKENRRRFLDKHPEIGELGVGEREKAIKAQMKQEAEMAYDTGITDYKTLREAVKLENSLSEQFGGATDAEKEANKRRAHDVALTTAKLSEDYDKKTFTSRKNLKDAKDSFVDRLLATPGSNLTEAQARAQADTVFANMKKMKGL